MQEFEIYLMMFRDGKSDEEIAAELVKRVEGSETFAFDGILSFLKTLRMRYNAQRALERFT